MNSVRPALSGTPQSGQTLQVSTGTWSPAPTSYGYAWHRCSSSGTNCSAEPDLDVVVELRARLGRRRLRDRGAGSPERALERPRRLARRAPSSRGTAVPSTGIAGGTGLYRLGPSWGIGTNYNRFAYSFSGRDDAVAVGAARREGARLHGGRRHQHGVQHRGRLHRRRSTTAGCSRMRAGNYMTGYGSYLGDVGNPDYQRRWADNVGNFLAQTGANGVYIDDVLSNISTWSDCDCFPAKYPSYSAWSERDGQLGRLHRAGLEGARVPGRRERARLHPGRSPL